MKEMVINGKFYSVDTATPLAGICSSYPGDDPRYYEEILYRKNNGEHFLYSRGGAQSKYASVNGAGSMILPLAEDEAKKWTTKHCSARVNNLIWSPPKS